jgi:hypothetical protein
MLYWHWFNRPRHPALRLLLAVLGILLVAGIVVLGFFALLAFAFIGATVALLRALTRSHRPVPGHAPIRDPQVIEGEFSVVHNDPALKH